MMLTYDRFRSFVSEDTVSNQSATCINTAANQQLTQHMHNQSETSSQYSAVQRPKVKEKTNGKLN